MTVKRRTVVDGAEGMASRGAVGELCRKYAVTAAQMYRWSGNLD